jgi:hypothetical protein
MQLVPRYAAVLMGCQATAGAVVYLAAPLGWLRAGAVVGAVQVCVLFYYCKSFSATRYSMETE